MVFGLKENNVFFWKLFFENGKWTFLKCPILKTDLTFQIFVS